MEERRLTSKPRRFERRIIEDGLNDMSIYKVFAQTCKETRQPVSGCVNALQCRDKFGVPSEAALSVQQVSPVLRSRIIASQSDSLSYIV